ncbi:MAG TPA: hypothetical protein VES19_17585 [Candidatus Limnocylindrales bacterium]|nr:hypothetical protein [Candidatus Limnocylindrales bacterium]
MTHPRLPDRDAGQVDALVADRYLEDLLAAGDRRAADAPADASLDPGLRAAARALRQTLVRVHPSFRFEERLAARLADLAAAQARPVLAAAGGGVVIPFPAVARPVNPARDRLAGADDPLLAAVLQGDLDPADEAAVERAAAGPLDRRPLIVGGTVITSAAISLVGVAIMAWRATRPTGRATAGADLTGSA